MNVAKRLKIISFNCWGLWLPGVCKYRTDRLKAITGELIDGDYDIVLLQEIWVEKDYQNLCVRLLPTFPYIHYFSSGVSGSGMCIFSKYIITETLFFKFTWNGYPYKFSHGDWYGGKGVGLSRILVNGIKLNVYVTHLHACYGKDVIFDQYQPYRIIQAFELSQFVKHTSETCDCIVVAGDFNSLPDDLPCRIIFSNANLMDAWTQQRQKQNDEGATCDRPENAFRSQRVIKAYPKGIRIDYITFRNNAGYSMVCETCDIMSKKVPGIDCPFSDHEGVVALFSVKKHLTAMPPERDSTTVESSLSEATTLIQGAIKRITGRLVKESAIVFLSLVFLVFVGAAQFGDQGLLLFLRFSVMAFFTLWVCAFLFFSRMDFNALQITRSDMNNLRRSENGPTKRF